MSENVSRRRFIGGLGAVAAGAVVGGGGVLGVQTSGWREAIQLFLSTAATKAGITTSQQDRLCFAAFDFVSTDRNDAITMFKAWTEASEKNVQGWTPAGAVAGDPNAPPDDTGEAFDLGAANLTLTFGFGSTFFSAFGLDAKKARGVG